MSPIPVLLVHRPLPDCSLPVAAVPLWSPRVLVMRALSMHAGAAVGAARSAYRLNWIPAQRRSKVAAPLSVEAALGGLAS